MKRSSQILVSALVAVLSLASSTVASASTIEISPLGSATTASIFSQDVACDTNNVVWMNSVGSSDLKTAPIERYRIDFNGTITALESVAIPKLNSSNISVGKDGKLYLVDSRHARIAVVTVTADSAIKKVRYIRTMRREYVRDVSADASGKVYVLTDGLIRVIQSNAKSTKKPIRTITFPYGNDDKSLAVSASGTIFVTDFQLGTVAAFTSEQTGSVTPARSIDVTNTLVSNGYGPIDVAVANDGSLLVVYWYSGIAHFNATDNGADVTPYLWNPLTGAFSNPQGVTVDTNNHMIVSDYLEGVGVKSFGLPVG